MSRLAHYRSHGFDQTEHIPFTKQYRIGCSQCAALVINGVPCHETGCPRAVHECDGCNALIPLNRKYCQDCS